MSSDELLNQPIPDDPDMADETAQALAGFFGAPDAPKGKSGVDLPSDLPSDDGPNAGEPTPKPTSKAPSNIDDKLEEARAQLEGLEESPQERYKRNLKQENISEVQAREILDRIVVQLKPYAERVPLSDTTYAVLRTRTQEDQKRLNEVLETMKPQYRMTIQTEIAKHNLACSLVSYGDVTFKRDDDGIEKAVRWLSNIPQPVFILLQNKLYEFDRKIDVVFQEGYIENFYRTPS